MENNRRWRLIPDATHTEAVSLIVGGAAYNGNVHDNIMRQAYDQRREEYLHSNGIKVIRFSNDEVKNNIDDVIRRILFECGVG